MLSKSLTSEEIARAYCQLIMVSTIGSNQIRVPTNNVAMCTLKVVYPDELGNNLGTTDLYKPVFLPPGKNQSCKTSSDQVCKS